MNIYIRHARALWRVHNPPYPVPRRKEEESCCSVPPPLTSENTELNSPNKLELVYGSVYPGCKLDVFKMDPGQVNSGTVNLLHLPYSPQYGAEPGFFQHFFQIEEVSFFKFRKGLNLIR